MTAHEKDLDECVEYFFNWMNIVSTPEQSARTKNKFKSAISGDLYDYFYGHVWAEERSRRHAIMYGNPDAPKPLGIINAKDEK